MDSKTKQQLLSELRVAEEFVKRDWHVFIDFGGKAPFDLVAYKDEKLLRVQIKSTSYLDKYNSYVVFLKRVRSNKTENKIYLFDKNSCDLLAVYVVPINKVCFIEPNKLRGTHTLSLKMRKNDNGRAYIIEDFLEPTAKGGNSA